MGIFILLLCDICKAFQRLWRFLRILFSFNLDMNKVNRKKAVLINGVIVLIASIPCVLGYNIWSDLHLIGGRDVLDNEDFLVSNLLLPLDH